MPRFLSMYKPATAEGTPPTEDQMTKMGALMQEWTAAGVLLSAEGCMPSATGARVRQHNGKVTAKDGPFTEAKELVGGLAILQAETRAEAVEWVTRFLAVAGDGECEVRQLW